MNATALREALQRALGLIPTLLLVSLIAFWGLSRALPADHSPRPDETTATLPLFLNLKPVGIEQRAQALALNVAHANDPGDAAHELIKLGAAALPGLMPFLDSLPPHARSRITLALTPLALRMGIAEQEELQSPEAALSFWNRYWTDHFIDFRPRVVERAVTRLAQRPSPLRRAEVRRLDTYALSELMRALAAKPTPEATAQLLSAVSEITGQPWQPAANTDPSALESQVARCLSWWRQERHRYDSFEGNRRVLAMLQETQYGQWVLDLIRGRAIAVRSMPGESHGAHWSIRPTLLLIAAGIAGGYVAGPILAALTAIAQGGRALALMLALLCASLPAATVASFLSEQGLTSPTVALLAMFVLGASLLCFYQYQATRDALSFNYVRTHRALGASRLRAALGALRSSGVVSAAHLANHGPSLFTAACVVEWAFNLNGLGWLTIHAVQHGDVATLAGIALCGTLLSGLLQIASGLILSRHELHNRALV